MGSIFYTYLVTKLVFTAFFGVGLYAYLKKETPYFIPHLIILIGVSGLIYDFIAPSIFSNVDLYQTTQLLEKEDVDKVFIFDERGTVLLKFRSENDISKVLDFIKRAESYSSNIGHIQKSYEMEILLSNNEVIKYEIVKTRSNGIVIFLKNKFKDRYYHIGRYRNMDVSLLSF
ncbi:hypothetical protein [Tenacibaculum sp. 190524A05c]|uniref:hypothetical protein n=1 Tax=Tenacibaculum platacis TaxID=3137852 RepID=UPI0032B2B3C1